MVSRRSNRRRKVLCRQQSKRKFFSSLDRNRRRSSARRYQRQWQERCRRQTLVPVPWLAYPWWARSSAPCGAWYRQTRSSQAPSPPDCSVFSPSYFGSNWPAAANPASTASAGSQPAYGRTQLLAEIISGHHHAGGDASPSKTSTTRRRTMMARGTPRGAVCESLDRELRRSARGA